jgi:hypothetical protein
VLKSAPGDEPSTAVAESITDERVIGVNAE